MSVATSVVSSSGSPTLSASTAGTSFSMNASYTAWCTTTRCTEMQIWPELANPPATTRCTARSRLASSSTMVAELLPSSSVTIFMPASLAICRPTGGLPVKLTMLVRSSVTILLPMVRPGADDDLEHAVGQAGLGQQLRQPQRGERRVGGRLEHDGVAAGQRRRDLVRHQVEREVERRDGGDHAARLADRPAEAVLAARVGVHLDEVAGRALGLLARPSGRCWRRAWPRRARP